MSGRRRHLVTPAEGYGTDDTDPHHMFMKMDFYDQATRVLLKEARQQERCRGLSSISTYRRRSGALPGPRGTARDL